MPSDASGLPPELALIKAAVEQALELQWSGRAAEAVEILRGVLAAETARLGADHPGLASIQNNLASCLTEIGRLNEAEPLIRHVVALAEAADPPHPALATRLYNLARFLGDSGRPEEAEPLFRRVIAIETERFGADHPEVAASLQALGRVLADLNRGDEAMAVFDTALAIYDRLPDQAEQRSAIGRRLTDLARDMGDAGRRREAIAIARRALAINESLASGHFYAARNLNLLGILLQEEGRLEEAEAAKRRALAINEQILDPGDPELGITLNNLGYQMLVTGRAAEAAEFLRRALEHAQAEPTPSPELIRSRADMLVSALRSLGRFAQAASLRPLADPSVPAAPSDTPGEASPLAGVLRRYLEQHDAAAPIPLALVAGAERSLRALAGVPAGTVDHALAELQEAGIVAGNESGVLLLRPAAASGGAAGDPQDDDALRLALEILDIGTPADVEDARHWPFWESVYPHASRLAERSRRLPPTPDTLGLELTIAMFELLAHGDAERAEARLRQAVATAAAMPPEKRLTAAGTDAHEASRGKLALLLGREKRNAEAVELLRGVLADEEARLGADHPLLATTLNNLAAFLVEVDRIPEAEPLIRRAVAISEAMDPPPAALGIRLYNLGDCLRSSERPQEAEAFVRRALAVEEAQGGPDDPAVARVLVLLGKVLGDQGKTADAFAAYARAAAIYGDQPATLEYRLPIANRVAELAGTAADAGRNEEALAYASWALDIHQQEPGPHHWAAADLGRLAELHYLTGDRAAAQEASRRALAIYEAILHPADPNLGTACFNLGVQLLDAGSNQEAEPLLRRALAIAEAAQPPDPDRVATRLEVLAETLRRLDRPEEAETLLPAPPKFPFH